MSKQHIAHKIRPGVSYKSKIEESSLHDSLISQRKSKKTRGPVVPVQHHEFFSSVDKSASKQNNLSSIDLLEDRSRGVRLPEIPNAKQQRGHQSIELKQYINAQDHKKRHIEDRLKQVYALKSEQSGALGSKKKSLMQQK